VYREHLTRLTSHRRSLEPLINEERLLNSLAADAALFHAEAHMKWLEHCAAVLKGWDPEALDSPASMAMQSNCHESVPDADDGADDSSPVRRERRVPQGRQRRRR
jgi:hypothetical protein